MQFTLVQFLLIFSCVVIPGAGPSYYYNTNYQKMAPVISHFQSNTLLILYKEHNKNGFVVYVIFVNFYIGW